MRELTVNEVEQVDGAGCQMSSTSKVELAVLSIISPLLGIGFLGMYYSTRDCVL